MESSEEEWEVSASWVIAASHFFLASAINSRQVESEGGGSEVIRRRDWMQGRRVGVEGEGLDRWVERAT